MNFLLRQATIIAPKQKNHNRVADIRIENGIIKEIGENLVLKDEREISSKKLMVSPGWFDMQADFCDPGNEHKEDLKSGLQAAVHGGYTGVLVMPSTQPVIDSKGAVEYVLKNGNHGAAKAYVAGSATKGAQGKELSESFDMQQAGAIAFTDHLHPIENAGLMKLALQYINGFGGLMMHFPFNVSLAHAGVMHEGKTSTIMGVKGMPDISESTAIQRDLAILEYTGGRLHFNCVSSAKSVKLISEAKSKGLKVTAGVPALNLILTDEALHEFDTRYKVMPPLRSESDRKALIEGLKNGTLDAVCSNHVPQDIELKKCEFDQAAFGAISIQTAYLGMSEIFSAEEWVEFNSIAPRKILGLSIPEINIGQKAEITLFDPEESTQVSAAFIKSKSKNSPLLGKSLSGKLIGVIAHHHHYLFS
jgi:dihydroorotase